MDSYTKMLLSTQGVTIRRPVSSFTAIYEYPELTEAQIRYNKLCNKYINNKRTLRTIFKVTILVVEFLVLISLILFGAYSFSKFYGEISGSLLSISLAYLLVQVMILSNMLLHDWLKLDCYYSIIIRKNGKKKIKW